MVHTESSPVVHLPPGIEAYTGKGMVEEYDSPDYDGSSELVGSSPPPRDSLSFSAHYDELFELSTDSDDELEDDHRPLDSEEVSASRIPTARDPRPAQPPPSPLRTDH